MLFTVKPFRIFRSIYLRQIESLRVLV